MVTSRCDDYHAELFGMKTGTEEDAPGTGVVTDDDREAPTTKVVTPPNSAATEGVVTK